MGADRRLGEVALDEPDRDPLAAESSAAEIAAGRATVESLEVFGDARHLGEGASIESCPRSRAGRRR
jgi:hypothetical protein